jgi:hypothetical protein
METIQKNTVEGYRTILTLLFILFLSITARVEAQTLYVDAVHGKPGSKATLEDPLSSLEEAVNLTNNFSGLEPVRIKLAPGTYVLNHELNLKTAALVKDTIAYTIEAMILPDDSAWEQFKMPLILSMSSNSNMAPFIHCVGFLVAKDNVSFKGLKFTGNYNSGVTAYYPVKRANRMLTGLQVSQCYFIGEKNTAAIEGALWLTGAGIRIDHCIFHFSKTAVILGGAIDGFSLTDSIISESYESALWYAASGSPFTFRNNVVINCKFVMVHPENRQPNYIFSDSYFSGNDNYLGSYILLKDKQVPVPSAVENKHVREINIHKTEKIKLVQRDTYGFPHDYLNLSPASEGVNTSAGIFKSK